MNWILRWVISGVALAIVGNLGIGVSYRDVGSLAIATIVIGLVNAFIRPILVLLTLPLNCLTFGPFGFILNGILFYAAGNAVDGFMVKWPWGALIGSVLMGFLSSILNSLLIDRKED